MTIKELEERVDIVALIEEDFIIQYIGNIVRVNPCPVCGKRDHFTVYPETNSYSSFNGCCEGGGPYQYLQEVKGMSKEEAHEEFKKRTVEGENIKSVSVSPPAKAEITDAPIKDFTSFIDQIFSNQIEKDKQYFIERGISHELIDKYKLCIGDIGDGKRAILPILQNGKAVFYTGRALSENQNPKYKNTIGVAPLFNSVYISKNLDDNIIFVTEGIFDALSIEGMGFNAIALGGTQHANKLIKAIEETEGANDKIYITAFDTDEAGKTATDKLGFMSLKLPTQYKDINEWCIKEEPKTIKNNLENQIQIIKRPDSVNEYLNKVFVTDIEKYKTFKDKKTGFKNLDSLMNGLYAGLYVVGGISSVGKTTFVHQMGDQLAEQGEHVIYFSLEQSKFEMVSKSLARLTARQNYNTAVSGISIRCGNINQEVLNASEKYEETSKRVNIVEGNFNTSVERIRKYVEDYIKLNKIRPVVIVDYLQIIAGSSIMQLGDKQRIDYTVTELKRISRDFDIPVFVVSSLNRGNYLSPVDYESFKESGGIEYTADVIWGLQLQAIHDPIFDTDKRIKEKRDTIRIAKASNPRKIELVCLKNRNGISSYSCGFIYYPKFDFYVPELIRE